MDETAVDECPECGELSFHFRGNLYSKVHLYPDGSEYMTWTDAYECLSEGCEHHEYYMLSTDLD